MNSRGDVLRANPDDQCATTSVSVSPAASPRAVCMYVNSLKKPFHFILIFLTRWLVQQKTKSGANLKAPVAPATTRHKKTRSITEVRFMTTTTTRVTLCQTQPAEDQDKEREKYPRCTHLSPAKSTPRPLSLFRCWPDTLLRSGQGQGPPTAPCAA